MDDVGGCDHGICSYGAHAIGRSTAVDAVTWFTPSLTLGVPAAAQFEEFKYDSKQLPPK